MANAPKNTLPDFPDEMKDFPRFLSYAENAPEIAAYRKAATTEVIVMIDRAFYDDGRQWAHRGEIVKVSADDAALLESVDQVRIVSKKS
jgi:hypothetical protein